MVLERTGRIERDSNPLSPAEVDVPRPASNEVLLRVEACAVCHTELDQIEGRVATPTPRILGHEVVGRIEEAGRDVDDLRPGRRTGVGWIASACGECRWCERGEENLCPDFRATGRDIDGGYAEYMTVDGRFAHPLPDDLDAEAAAPMLCAGAIGLRSLRLAGLEDGRVLALTGFGASNHLVLTLARILYPGSPVLVWARDAGQRDQALERGAAWAGDIGDRPPDAPDAVIDTTPVWAPVLSALEQLAPGGRLVINAISKESGDRDRLADLDYPKQLWREKEIKSVANVTRSDIADYLAIAAEHDMAPETRSVPLDEANEALRTIRFGDFRGAFVLRPGDGD